MNQNGQALLEKVRREALDRLRGQPAPHVEPRTIHYTQLPEDPSTSPIAAEWNFYRREAGRLLAEGHEGRWVLIKGGKVIGIWDSQEAAYDVALKDYLMQPVLIHQVLTLEPVLRGPSLVRQCRS